MCCKKKEECTRPDAALSFDVALTFREPWSWVEEEGIDLESLPVTDFDPYPNLGRLFPTEGGILKAAGIEDGVVSPRTVMASGIENCVEVIDYLTTGTATVDIVDLMACEGGCLGGPGSANNLNVFARRQKLHKVLGISDEPA